MEFILAAVADIPPEAYTHSVRDSHAEIELRFRLTPLMFKAVLLATERLGLDVVDDKQDCIAHYHGDMRHYVKQDIWQVKKQETKTELTPRTVLVRSMERAIEAPKTPSDLTVATVRRYTRRRYRLSTMAFVDVTYSLQSSTEHTNNKLLGLEPYKESDMDRALFRAYLDGAPVGRVHHHDGCFVTEHFSVEVEFSGHGAEFDAGVVGFVAMINGIVNAAPVPAAIVAHCSPTMPSGIRRHHIGAGPGSISYKLDGERARLLLTGEGLFWQSRIDIDALQMQKVADITNSNETRQLEAELYQGQCVFAPLSHRAIMFYVFEDQCSDDELQQYGLADYLEVKPAFHYTTRVGLRDACYQAVSMFNRYVCDGLMFRINNEDFKFKTTWTIDVGVKLGSDLHVIKSRTKNEHVQLFNTVRIASINPQVFFSNHHPARTPSRSIMASLNHSVVECALLGGDDVGQDSFVFMRQRHDKQEIHMNSSRLYAEHTREVVDCRRVARSILIDEAWVMVAMHNAAKRAVIEECKQHNPARIIDIGSGVGGDASKYSGMSGQLICVELDLAKIAELTRRVRTSVLPNHIILGKSIQDALVTDIKHCTCTVAMLLFCINFTPPSELATLFKGLADVGTTDIHIMFMDGDLVLGTAAAFRDKYRDNHPDMVTWDSSVKGAPHWRIATGMWSIQSSPHGRYVINITGSIVEGQTEYLVSSRDIYTAADQAGYRLVSTSSVCASAQSTAATKARYHDAALTPNEVCLNNMYRYMHLQTRGS